MRGMGEFVVVDVVDRPRGGAGHALRRLRRARGSDPALQAAIGMRTVRFTPYVVPRLTPWRIAVLSSFADAPAADRLWPQVVGPVVEGAREHWQVRGDLARADFSEPRAGWLPEAVGPDLADDEPALVVISGELHARYVPRFARDQRSAVAHAHRSEGYLGGLGAQSSIWDTTSISAWRSYADAKRYAYSSGGHREAMKRDLAEAGHRTMWFLRVRPTSESGTLAGRRVFGELLAATGAVVPQQAIPDREKDPA